MLKFIQGLYQGLLLGFVNVLFQLGLSLDSFKNSFVGDFATLALNPLLQLLETRPSVSLRVAICYNFKKDNYAKDNYAKDNYATAINAKDNYATAINAKDNYATLKTELKIIPYYNSLL